MLVSVAGPRFILSDHLTTNNDIRSTREQHLFGSMLLNDEGGVQNSKSRRDGVRPRQFYILFKRMYLWPVLFDDYDNNNTKAHHAL